MSLSPKRGFFSPLIRKTEMGTCQDEEYQREDDEQDPDTKNTADLFGLKCLLMAYQLFNPFNKKENDLKGYPIKFVYF